VKARERSKGGRGESEGEVRSEGEVKARERSKGGRGESEGEVRARER
jgi:hypothetical protein